MSGCDIVIKGQCFMPHIVTRRSTGSVSCVPDIEMSFFLPSVDRKGSYVSMAFVSPSSHVISGTLHLLGPGPGPGPRYPIHTCPD